VFEYVGPERFGWWGQRAVLAECLGETGIEGLQNADGEGNDFHGEGGPGEHGLNEGNGAASEGCRDWD